MDKKIIVIGGCPGKTALTPLAHTEMGTIGCDLAQGIDRTVLVTLTKEFDQIIIVDVKDLQDIDPDKLPKQPSPPKIPFELATVEPLRNFPEPKNYITGKNLPRKKKKRK